MVVPDVRMSPDVRRLLGPEMQQKVLTAPLDQARCPVCRQPVPAAGPVNVVVSVSAPMHRVTFAHPGCAPSAVMHDEIDLSDMLPDEAAMNTQALLLPHGGAALPVLAAERPLDAYLAAPELTDLLVATLLHEGLALIARVREAPRVMLDWRATLTPRPGGPDLLLIESGPDRLFYEGDLPVVPGWWSAVERHGWCVLYSGNHIGRADGSGVDLHTLRAAAAAGTLVGARLRLTRSAP